MVFCTKCGVQLPNEAQFCMKCGSKMKVEDMADEQYVVTPEPVMPPSDDNNKNQSLIPRAYPLPIGKPIPEARPIPVVQSPHHSSYLPPKKSKWKIPVALIVTFVLIGSGAFSYVNYVDSDFDGVYNWNDEFPDDSDESKDTDGDGFGDNGDIFPKDKTEWIDTDNDGLGDNTDEFPTDATEQYDFDNDGTGNNADPFIYDATQWSDIDNDGYGDNPEGTNPDLFPNDSNDWVDNDNDGIGDNSDNDDDNDGFLDIVDIDPFIDVSLEITLTAIRVDDELNFWDWGGELYFMIYINGVFVTRIDDNGEGFGIQVGYVFQLNETFVYNIPDNKVIQEINIQAWDVGFWSDQLVDIDGHNSSSGMTLYYSYINNTYYGDDDNGISNGSLDGTSDSDDNDAIISYELRFIKTPNIRFYNWTYGGSTWSWELTFDMETYYYYKSLDHTITYESDYAEYVTPDDTLIISMGEKLIEAAEKEGYTDEETLNFALRFVQTLEYTSDNVSAGLGEYPRYPIETLIDQLGDCEDSSALYASLVEAMGHDAVFLLLPGHAAVGVAGDFTGKGYMYNEIMYFFAETTNVGWEIGELPDFDDSSASIYDV